MSRVPTPGAIAGVVLAISAIAAPPAAAQLRPYEPVDWEILDSPAVVVGHLGAGILLGQRASLAGTEGRLAELGHFQLTARSGRILLEAAGTALRVLDERSRFAPAFDGTESRPIGVRRDVGDFLVSTGFLLNSPGAPAIAIVRFGTRLPTTDNRVGLERDRTDFFALLGGRFDRGIFRAAAEAGLGIHGSHNPDFEQSDVLVYLLSAGVRSDPVRATVLLLGQTDGLDGWTLRGNENLSELRLRVRTGHHYWLQLEAGRGLTSFSPDFGLHLAVGAAF